MTHASFHIHGVTLRVTGNAHNALESLIDRMGPYQTESEGNVVLQIHLTDDRETLPDEIRSIRREFHWLRSRPLWGDLNENILRITDGASTIHLDYKEKRAGLRLAKETVLDPLFFSRTFLLLPVVELLRTQGFLYIHGSLVKNGECAILFLGEGGSGKSTLAAALLSQGWKFVADDNLLLQASTLDLFPLEQELSLTKKTAVEFGFHHVTKNEERKVRISKASLPSHSKIPFARPTDAVMLRLGPDDRIDPLSRSSLFHALLQENPMPLIFPPLAIPSIRGFQRLAQNLHCWELRLSHGKPPRLDNLSSRFNRLFSKQKMEHPPSHLC